MGNRAIRQLGDWGDWIETAGRKQLAADSDPVD
jgi:hypothetical protein